MTRSRKTSNRGVVEHIAFTLYPVKDMRRARRFYERALGLRMTKSFRGEWIEYHLSNGCFAIATAAKSFGPNAKSTQIAFEVDDVDAVVDRLCSNGAKIKMAPTSGSVCRVADLIDTEGNAFMIHAKHRRVH